MIDKIKDLGLALVAVAALGMLAASVVQASEFHITTNPSTSVFGRQTAQIHKFQLTKPGINTQCAQVLFEGTQTGTPTQDLTLTATYTGCTCFGVACQIKMNGCKYTITGAGQPALTAKVDIVGCTAGLKIELVSPLGTVTVGEQSAVGGHILFANEGVHPNGSLTATITLQGITYQCDGTIPGCANGTTTVDGDYVGQATFEAKTEAGSAQVTHNGHQFQKLSQNGKLVGLVAT